MEIPLKFKYLELYPEGSAVPYQIMCIPECDYSHYNSTHNLKIYTISDLSSNSFHNVNESIMVLDISQNRPTTPIFVYGFLWEKFKKIVEDYNYKYFFNKIRYNTNLDDTLDDFIDYLNNDSPNKDEIFRDSYNWNTFIQEFDKYKRLKDNFFTKIYVDDSTTI